MSDLSSLQGRELERGVNSNTSIGKKHQNNSSETNLFTHLPIHLFTSKKSAFTLAEGASHVAHCKDSRKVAFTLAEVLITLGIIGVVAALTMPVLISNVQDRVKQKRIENIKQKLSKVTDAMSATSGLNGYADTMSFIQEMNKHMKIAKICDNSNLSACWPTKEVILDDEGKTWDISKTKNAKTLKINKDVADNWADTVGIVTVDGTAMILSYDKTCNFNPDVTGYTYSNGLSNSATCLSGVFDWNGGKNPNKLGKDVMTLGVAKGLGNSCALEVGNLCFSAAFTPTPLTYAECEEQKSTLGVEYCEFTDYYWAGAVKQCGGIDKMPTLADLGKLATELYGVQVGAKQDIDEGLTIDTSKAASMGLTESYIHILASDYPGEGAFRSFGPSETSWDTINHGLITTKAVCVGD